MPAHDFAVETVAQTPDAGAPWKARRDSVWFVRCTVTFALAAGLAEACILLVQREIFQRFIWTSTEVIWMAPVSYLLLLAPIGVLVALLALAWKSPALPVLTVFAFAVLTVDCLLFTAFAERLHTVARLILSGGIAVQFALASTRSARRFDRVMRRAPLILGSVALLSGLALADWRYQQQSGALKALPQAKKGAPNVLVIVLDAVRASMMSVYGYGEPTTPQLERISRNSVVFERAFAPSSWTLPSHATMFTGRFSHELGVGWMRPLDRRFPTIAEAFQANGYITGGFTANYFYTTRETGLQRGFLHWEGRKLSVRQVLLSSMLGQRVDDQLGGRRTSERKSDRKSAPDVTGGLTSWIRQRDGRPFFAFLNYFSAHKPYLAPEPFRRRFGRGSKNRYAASVSYLDAEIATLLNTLKREGVLDNTIVVITSDHGEHLGENGRRGHGNNVYNQVLHVPLIVLARGRVAGGKRIDTPVSTRDLPATLLDLAGISNSSFPGQSLVRFLDSTAQQNPTPVFSEVRPAMGSISENPNGGPPIYSLVDESRHYIRFNDGREELYAYGEDPDEARNLVKNPAEAAALLNFRIALAELLSGTFRRR